MSWQVIYQQPRT